MTAIEIGLNAAIFAVTDEAPRILTIRDPAFDAEPSLPFGRLDPVEDRTLELGLRGWVRRQTGLELGFVEQLYTFGDRDRVAGPADAEGARFLSVAYVALVREEESSPGAGAAWRSVYEFLPWEDWRTGRPTVLERVVLPGLRAWVSTKPAERQARSERVEIAFGLGDAGWDNERVLDRYELVYEAGLVSESGGAGLGEGMAMDHRRILATALGRVRGKLKYRPVVFELLPANFTLLQLQRVVESMAGVLLHKQNFRRLVERAGLVEGTGRMQKGTGGRPAELFAFRREVARERPAPGVGLPGLPRTAT